MATPEGLQALLELTDAEFSAVWMDRLRALEEASAQFIDAASQPPSAAAVIVVLELKATADAAHDRVEEVALACGMRIAVLKAQIAELEALR